MAEITLLPKCPECGRLTVDNRQHCPEKTTAQWAKCCQMMVCAKCGYTYSKAGWPGFPKFTGRITGGTP